MKKMKNSQELKNMKDTKETAGGKAVKASKKIKKIVTFQEFRSWVNIFVICAASPSKNLTTRLVEFYHLWPLHQWISSLVGLIVLYWITGYYYNKWLSDKGGWLNWKKRIWLIMFDFSINLLLGLYYMNYRETVLGAIMLTCPIAISPLIFILELICFYMYSRFVKKKQIEK